MLKQNKGKLLISSIVILLPILVGLARWNDLPQRMAVHWDFNGAPDNWLGKGFTVFAMPLILLAVQWLCVVVTSLDPKNKDQSRKAMGLVFWLCPIISLFANGAIYAAALGLKFNVSVLAPLVVGLMFVVIGNYLPKCKQNYTVGIKIIWTLDSEENWNATHRFAGKVWVIGGVLLLLCAFLPAASIPYVLIPCLTLMVGAPILYSYLYYRRQK